MKLFKFKCKKGQHTIEYAVLLMLIMAGIMVAGPYVIRSWNANLKGWEDSVIDSFQDPLVEAPDDSVTFPGCTPSPWEELGCNLGRVDPCTGKTVSCSEVEMTSMRTFDPEGCQCLIKPEPPPSVQCTVNNCCCTDPQPTGRCGAQATIVTGLSEPACNTVMTPKNPDGTCPDGMMESWVLCGSDEDPDGRRFGCVPDPACVFECTSPPFIPDPPVEGDAYGVMCPGDSSGLTGDIPNSFVAEGACTAKKCETQCAPDFYPKGGGTFCGPCDTLGIITDCEPGFYDPTDCGEGMIRTCCYESGADPD